MLKHNARVNVLLLPTTWWKIWKIRPTAVVFLLFFFFFCCVVLFLILCPHVFSSFNLTVSYGLSLFLGKRFGFSWKLGESAVTTTIGFCPLNKMICYLCQMLQHNQPDITAARKTSEHPLQSCFSCLHCSWKIRRGGTCFLTCFYLISSLWSSELSFIKRLSFFFLVLSPVCHHTSCLHLVNSGLQKSIYITKCVDSCRWVSSADP